ncbi:DUF4405 domain-containing protein [Phaeobacter sp. PT47_59]|uniref:DUF4405 domain-containing protein n=1 Tax=Phaeobacter sp. PT47_59 TaxID=3029979 RepID=UPI0023802C03|nr:DUF4405 domain-containing protein [Phaeobacter sp. PT47_59]MDE4173298.1 DUF4405 domain-containing protein [Phaeobacter sp. PT47_59]
MRMLRTWATPLTIGSFLLMGVTGLLMFFHLDSGLNKVVHEWVGWVMVAGVLAHVLLNWRAFSVYFKRPVAVTIMALSAVVLAGSFVPVSGGGSPVRPVMMAVTQATVGAVIGVSGVPEQVALSRLGAAGFDATLETPLPDLTGGDREKEMAILSLLFQG